MKNSTLFAALLISTGVVAQTSDYSFEGSLADTTIWHQFSENFGTPLCDAGCGTCGGPCAPLTGDVYAWFGGAGDASELGVLNQDVFVPTGTVVELEAWVKMPAFGDGSDDNYLKAFADGNELGAITAGDSLAWNGFYHRWAVSLAGYTGGMHNIRLEGKENGTVVFNVLVDDVNIKVDGDVFVGLFENESVHMLTVYPNPANDRITLNFNSLSGNAVVSLVDVSGKMINRQRIAQVANSLIEFDAKLLANGVYTVTVENGGKIYQERIVVAH